MSQAVSPEARASLPELGTWLVLRWGATGALLVVALLVAWLLHLSLPWIYLLGVLALAVCSNLGLGWYARRAASEPPQGALALLVCLDLTLLTWVLGLTGGALNPFAFLYVVYIALAAATLRAIWVWSLVAAAAGLYGALFFLMDPMQDHAHHMQMLDLHLQGMWYAFVITAAMVVWYIRRVRAALARREGELVRLRAQHAREQRLASLATLSATAAHELSTPLSTIAVVAREMELGLQGDPDMVEDARLVRAQVDQCQAILRQMSQDAGQSMGEASESMTAPTLLGSLPEALPRQIDPAVERWRVSAPPLAWSQVLGELVRNARRVGQERGVDPRVQVSLRAQDQGVLVEVRDQAGGMSPEVLRQAPEPFFQDRQREGGMGLGLFLARALVERLGGRFWLESQPGQGTCVSLWLPREE